MNNRRSLRMLVLVIAAWAAIATAIAAERAPNIVLIYGDDIGYGDFGCYGADTVKTPHVDRLAREGLRFTHAYASSATCTPSRYSLLTGEYAFRRPGTAVLPGDATLIIDPARGTLPGMLQQAGYSTGVIGKWHLGLGKRGEPIDWNKPIRPGAREVGFGYSFLLPATGDRVPCVYVENGRVRGLDPADPIQVSYRQAFPGQPTGLNARDTLRMDWSKGHNMSIVNGVGRIGYMIGGRAARWNDEEMADVFVARARDFLRREKDKRFFLYFSTHDIHVPRLPHPRFAGRSGMGPRGDALLQFDWCVGEILAELDRLGRRENTLVILTSDNGPVLDDGYKDRAVELLGRHRPAGPLRGGKYSRFEAGTRVPFIVRWPGRVRAGESAALVSQVDLYASFARLAGGAVSAGAAPDSIDVLAALLGQSAIGRDHIVQHAKAGLALYAGNWKYIEPTKGLAAGDNKSIERGELPQPQLYDLAADPGETRNLAADQPERTAALAARLNAIRQRATEVR